MIPLLVISFSVNANPICDSLKGFAESAMKNKQANTDIKLVLKAVNKNPYRAELSKIVYDAYTSNESTKAFANKWYAVCMMAVKE